AEPFPKEVGDWVKSALYQPLKQAFMTPGKHQRKTAVKTVTEPFLALIPEDEQERRVHVKKVIHDLEEEILRDTVIGERRRFDGRALDEVRPITIQVGLLPRTHGSALFTRGAGRDAQIIEEYEGESKQRFLLHYNFPPFSVGEVKFLRGPGRREIGHGRSEERAIRPMMPPDEEFPYTIRLVSDILESNGSSSMASICGGSLCLMDAGVPLRSAVAGAAMGLVKEGENYAILSDIAGSEDHYGDMDFKVAGTRKGITALQMDIKIQGISKAIMEEALQQAHRARLHILEIMN